MSGKITQFAVLYSKAAVLLFAWTYALHADYDSILTELAQVSEPNQQIRLVWSGHTTSAARKTIFTIDTREYKKGQLLSRDLYPNSTYHKPSYTTFSRDGTRILFQETMSGDIFVVNWDGTGLRTVAQGYIAGETWRSPVDSSDWILCAENRRSTYGP